MQQMCQLQAQQFFAAQQMHMYQAQQAADADVAMQTKNKRQGKHRKNKKAYETQRATVQKVVSQESPDGASLSGKDSEDTLKHMLLEAVKSLYKDQIVPHHVLVLRRIHEKYGERWSPQKLKHFCFEVPEIQVEATGELKRYNVTLRDTPEGFEDFVDQLSPEDPYHPDLWLEVQAFLEDESHKPQTGWPGSRYEFAKWMHSHLQCLGEYSLGQICHLVQLSVSSKELLGYRLGNLVPYQHSDDYKKKSNALLNVPTQILPGEMYVETWEQAGELIAGLLEHNGGSLQLSSLKKAFRDEYQMELSESALGHAKLSEFLKDHRLKTPSGGMFHLIQQPTGCVISLMEFSKQSIMGTASLSTKDKNSYTNTSTDSDAKSTAASDDGSHGTPRDQSQLSPGLSPCAAPAFLPPPGLEFYEYPVASDDPMWIRPSLPFGMQF
jgi:hypothetical protein